MTGQAASRAKNDKYNPAKAVGMLTGIFTAVDGVAAAAGAGVMTLMGVENNVASTSLQIGTGVAFLAGAMLAFEDYLRYGPGYEYRNNIDGKPYWAADHDFDERMTASKKMLSFYAGCTFLAMAILGGSAYGIYETPVPKTPQAAAPSAP